MLKLRSSNTRFSSDNSSDAISDNSAEASVWTLKSLLAIALFGILLSISNSSRFLQQSGKYIALFAGGAAVTMRFQGNELSPENPQLRSALQTAQAPQVADLLALESQQQQVLCELYESAIAEATLLATAATANATSQAAIAQFQDRIAELEAALAHKTTLATEMLTELEAEATHTFDQFSAKIAAQDALINNLHRQIESLSATNAALTAQHTNELFAGIGTDPLSRHDVLNQLVKR